MEVRSRLVPILVTLTVIAYVLMVVFNGLAGAGYKGLFASSIGDVSNKYSTYLTPAGWTFSIWSLIYIALAAGVIYNVSTIFRLRGSQRVYQTSPILGWYYYSVVIVNFILNTIWVFIWIYEYVVAAAIILLFIAYTNWLAIGIVCHSGKKTIDRMGQTALTKLTITEVRLQRVLLQNGIAIYATWTTIASLLNLNIAFQYVGHYDAETTSIVCTAILLTIIIVWFILENTILDKYVRYMISQYPVVMFASGGIVDNQIKKSHAAEGSHSFPKSVSILTWCVLAVASGLLLARLVIVIYRSRTRPLHSDVNSVDSNRSNSNSTDKQ